MSANHLQNGLVTRQYHAPIYSKSTSEDDVATIRDERESLISSPEDDAAVGFDARRSRWSNNTFGQVAGQSCVNLASPFSEIGSEDGFSDDEDCSVDIQYARHVARFGRSAFNLAPRTSVYSTASRRSRLGVHTNFSTMDVSAFSPRSPLSPSPNSPSMKSPSMKSPAMKSPTLKSPTLRSPTMQWPVPTAQPEPSNICHLATSEGPKSYPSRARAASYTTPGRSRLGHSVAPPPRPPPKSPKRLASSPASLDVPQLSTLPLATHSPSAQMPRHDLDSTIPPVPPLLPPRSSSYTSHTAAHAYPSPPDYTTPPILEASNDTEWTRVINHKNVKSARTSGQTWVTSSSSSCPVTPISVSISRTPSAQTSSTGQPSTTKTAYSFRTHCSKESKDSSLTPLSATPTDTSRLRSSSKHVDDDLTALPSAAAMAEAQQYKIYAEDESLVTFGSVCPKEKTNPNGPAPRLLVFFVRVFFCGLCHDYIKASINKLDRAALEQSNIAVVIIANGHKEGIKGYRKAMNCPYPVFADPSRGLYALFNLPTGLSITDLVAPDYKPGYNQSALPVQLAQGFIRAMTRFPKGAGGGSIYQLGGEAVIGPGGRCEFIHRMTHPRDHMEAADVARAAGCILPTQSSGRYQSFHSGDDDASHWAQLGEPNMGPAEFANRYLRHIQTHSRRTSGVTGGDSDSSPSRTQNPSKTAEASVVINPLDDPAPKNEARDMALYRLLAEYLESSERLDRFSAYSTDWPAKVGFSSYADGEPDVAFGLDQEELLDSPSCHRAY